MTPLRGPSRFRGEFSCHCSSPRVELGLGSDLEPTSSIRSFETASTQSVQPDEPSAFPPVLIDRVNIQNDWSNTIEADILGLTGTSMATISISRHALKLLGRGKVLSPSHDTSDLPRQPSQVIRTREALKGGIQRRPYHLIWHSGSKRLLLRMEFIHSTEENQWDSGDRSSVRCCC